MIRNRTAQRICRGALALVLAASVASAAAPPLPAALPDQYGEPLALTDMPAEPVLAIVVAGRQLRQVQRWEEALRAELPELVSLRVADITELPRPTLEQVAGKLRERAPAGVSILIDTDNTWAQAFNLDTSQPCLLLFNPQRELVALWRGKPRRALVSDVIGHLQAAAAARGSS